MLTRERSHVPATEKPVISISKIPRSHRSIQSSPFGYVDLDQLQFRKMEGCDRVSNQPTH